MTIYFVDLDGTVVPHGNPRTFIEANKARLDEIAADPNNEVWFFSCWAFSQSDIEFLRATCPYAKGCIRKPLADKYVFIDDKHDVDTSLLEASRFFPSTNV